MFLKFILFTLRKRSIGILEEEKCKAFICESLRLTHAHHLFFGKFEFCFHLVTRTLFYKSVEIPKGKKFQEGIELWKTEETKLFPDESWPLLQYYYPNFPDWHFECFQIFAAKNLLRCFYNPFINKNERNWIFFVRKVTTQYPNGFLELGSFSLHHSRVPDPLRS